MMPAAGDDIALIGHRGCAGQYPENTVSAFERAAPHVDAVELDVRRCASGEPVVVHDETLDRLTGGSGRVAETAWSELRSLSVLGSGDPIPRLADALAAVPADTAVNVELKAPAVVDDALAAAREVENEVWFSSFLPETLAAIRERDRDADRALLVADAGSDRPVEAVIDRAVDLDCAAVHPSMALATEPGVVDAAREAGLAVYVWTAADRADAMRLRDAGVDGIIADRWDLLPGRD